MRAGADARDDRAADGIGDGVRGLLKEHVSCHGEVHVCGAGNGGGHLERVGRWGEKVDAATEDDRLSSDRAKRGGLVEGPQAGQESGSSVE